MPELIGFVWTELERFVRIHNGERQTVVRARCQCGLVKLMPASAFDQRMTRQCNTCRLKRAYASGWARPRLVRRKRGDVKVLDGKGS